MIVVDTNVIAYMVLPGPHAPKAAAVRQRDPIWHTPPLWHHEMLNVLAMQMSHAGATLDECLRAHEQAARLVLVTTPPAVEHVLRLSAGSGCTSYDCEFVAVAEKLQTTLVTTDKQILAAFPQTAVSPEAFIA